MPKYHLTDNARVFRRLMWITALIALPALVLAIRGAQGLVSMFLGVLGGLVFLSALGLAALLGLKMHRQTLADRDMQARRAMIVMMAETLGKETDEKLEEIRGQGGMAGEAAELILKGRQAKADE